MSPPGRALGVRQVREEIVNEMSEGDRAALALEYARAPGCVEPELGTEYLRKVWVSEQNRCSV